MPKLLKNNNRVLVAKGLIDSLSRVSPSPEYLYLFFGRSSAWTDENAPDTPTDNVSIDITTRENIIGIKRVTQSNIAFVVPRYNWTSGTVYDQYSASDAALFTKDFYVLNSQNNVYKCLSNNTNAVSVVEPSGTSTSTISTGDGYQWKFMYNLSSQMIVDFLTSDWLPVPYGGQKTAFQTAVENAASYSSGQPAGGHGKNAIEELGASRIMISQVFDKSESGILPTNDDFRQCGLWVNPLLLNGSAATGTTYICNDSNSNINEYTGSLLYIDNRKVITRDPDQTESFRMVFNF